MLSTVLEMSKTFFQIRPEWRIEDLFALTDVQNALFTDSLFTTRKMTLYKESPSDILALYDNIAYAKGVVMSILCNFNDLIFYLLTFLSGGSLLRMFYNVLGDETFFSAVTQLLNTA